MRRVAAVVLGVVSAVLAATAVHVWAGILTEPAVQPTPVAGVQQPTPVVQRWAPPRVEVADGVDIDQAEVAAYVATIVNDPRGWRTDMGAFTVRIVQAGTEGTQRMPGKIGWADPGRLTAVNSDEAWTVLGPKFAAAGGTLDDQRAWVVLHELGHLLGYGHEECLGSGPAPIMRESTYDLGGCGVNVWPHPQG